jgi:hypothetical protein
MMYVNGRRYSMTPTAMKLNNLLDNLEEEDYNIAIGFIQYLSDARKKKNAERSKALLTEIQSEFVNDQGWESEEQMLQDMASFRKARINS